MAGAAAEVAEQRLWRQEQELRWLTAEVGRLKEREAPCGAGSCSPELQRLRAENEKLRYRLLHLRRSLAAELGRAAPAEQRPPGPVAAEPLAGGEVEPARGPGQPRRASRCGRQGWRGERPLRERGGTVPGGTRGSGSPAGPVSGPGVPGSASPQGPGLFPGVECLHQATERWFCCPLARFILPGSRWGDCAGGGCSSKIGEIEKILLGEQFCCVRWTSKGCSLDVSCKVFPL